MLYIGRMRISSRGKFIEYVCTDPKAQRESFPRQQKCLHVHGVQAASWAALLPGLVGGFYRGQDAASLLQEGWAILAEQARGPSNPLLTLLTNGMERKVAGQSEGWIESSPGRSWPSCLTADKWILETDGAVCNPNERRQVQWWGKQHLPSLPTDGQASTYGPATGYDFNYLYVKSKLGMVIWV